MSKRKFAVVDCGLGLLVSLLVLLAFGMQWGDGIELKLYDLRARLRAHGKPTDNLILVGIDDPSLREIGRWPWPRTYIAEAVDQLSEAGAKVIGLDVFFSNAEINPGLQEVRALKQAMAERKSAAEFVLLLDAAEKRLDNDTRLSDSLALAQNTVLPLYFQEGEAIGRNTKAIPAEVEKNFIASAKSNGAAMVTVDFSAPYETFAKSAKGIGQANLWPSTDGVQRAVPLVVDYNGRLFPSFALQVLRAYYNLENDE
jgi:hypothetical protein